MSADYLNSNEYNMYREISSKWSFQSGKPCIITEDNLYTFSWIQNQIELFGNFLHEHSIQKKAPEKILLIEDNSILAIIILLFCAKKNILFAPLSPSLTNQQIEIQKNIIKPDVMITKSAKSNQIISMHDKISTYVVNDVRYQVQFNEKNLTSGRTSSNCKTWDKEFLLTTTSGSTGSPKPVIFSQKTKMIRAGSAISHWNLTSDDIIINASPIHSSLGQRLSITSLLSGSTCILLHKFTEKQWINLGSCHGVTFTIPVTSHLEVLSRNSKFWDIISSTKFKGIVSSSSFLSENLKNRLTKKLNHKFYEMYGASEIGTATVLDGSAEVTKTSSVGKALPGIDIRILDNEGMIAEEMHLGEIAVKTNCIFSGYYNHHEQTKKAMNNGYFLTGDLGYMDKDGYVYFKSRIKEVIKTGGYSIYCSDIEGCILSLEYVKHCKAMPTSHAVLGSVAVAFVELESNLCMIDTEKFSRKIKGYCAKNLAAYQVPQKIFIIDKMPKLRNEKINVQELNLIMSQKDSI